jgi:RES domain-containing protein
VGELLTLHRLTLAKYAGTALSGIGGLHAAGRWHRAGHPVVYASESTALAVLEVLAGTRDRTVLRDASYVRLTVDVPAEGIVRLSGAELPPDWQAWPHGESAQELGSRWLASRASLGLSVPSTLIPTERNVLLNPLHPDWGRVEASGPEAFVFDARLGE